MRKETDFSDQTLSRIHIPITIENVEYIIIISELAATPLDIMGDKVMNAAAINKN